MRQSNLAYGRLVELEEEALVGVGIGGVIVGVLIAVRGVVAVAVAGIVIGIGWVKIVSQRLALLMLLSLLLLRRQRPLLLLPHQRSGGREWKSACIQ